MRSSEEPLSRGARLRRLLFVAFWIALGIGAVGFLLVRARIRADAAEAALDAHVAELQADLARADAAAASGSREATRAEIAHLQAERRLLQDRLPCALDVDSLLPELKARLEPLGVQMRTDLGFRQQHPEHLEARIPLVLPEDPGVEARLRAALSGIERVTALEAYGEDAGSLVLVAYAQGPCTTEPPPLPEIRAVVPGRDLLVWPFDRGVKQLELEAAAIAARRQERSEILRELEMLRRVREEADAARRLLAWLDSRQGQAGDAAGRSAPNESRPSDDSAPAQDPAAR